MTEDDTSAKKRVDADIEDSTTGIDRSDQTNRLVTDGGTTNPDDPAESDSISTPSSQGVSAEEGDEEIPSLTPSVRKFIFADRNKECELCGANGTDEDVSLEVHHRVQKADGGTNHPENLLLLCQKCHQQHHGNQPVKAVVAEMQETTEPSGNSDGQPNKGETSSKSLADTSTESGDCSPAEDGTSPTAEDTEPLPPRSTPNGADKEIIAHIESYGAATTGQLAEALDYSKVYIRRQCWKLSGEQLIVPQDDNTWELVERASHDRIQIGLPKDPKKAKRAGRDEIIRRMSAHGMAHTQIAEITGLSRGTIDIAVNRARALRIDDSNDTTVDLATVATRLSALLELIDKCQIGTDADHDLSDEAES